ncbi:MAG: outer membrane protein assembly factor BamA [Spirochaetaceae bacterium]|nr:outer membrane protein assembly factor BamA [Spirochaetaceae bacterium]
MKKRVMVAMLLTLFLTTSLFAAETPWYEGAKISNFETYGLQNVSGNTIDNILFQYRNKIYTDDLSNEIQAKLYATEGVSYFYPEAKKDPKDSKKLILSYTFFEKQMLKIVSFDGNSKLKDAILLDDSGLIINSFYEGTELSLAKIKIQKAYTDKGYSNCLVTTTLTANEADNTVSVNFNIREGSQIIVSEISFAGNDSFSNDILKKQITSKTKSFFNNGYYSPTNVAKDLKNLKTYYSEKGYINCNISEPKQEIVGTSGNIQTVKLVYEILEGKIWKFGDLNISGNTVFSTEKILESFSLKNGDIFDTTSFESSISKITDLYYNEGYINLKFIPKQKVDQENNIISFDFTLNEGTKFKINEIIFNGLNKTDRKVFEREMTIKAGDYFSKAALMKSLQNIQNTHLVTTDLKFNVVPLQTEGECNIIIDLSQGGQRDIQFGATFGGSTTDFPISGLLVLTERNLFGTGNDLSLSTNLSPTTQKASVSYTDEYFGDIPWSNTFSISAQHKSVSDALSLGNGGFYKNKIDNENAFPAGYNSYEAYVAANEALPDSSYLMSYSITTFSAGYNTGYTFKYNPGNLTLSTGLDFSINKAYFDGTSDPFDYLLYRYGQNWCFSNKYNVGITWDGRDLKSGTTRGYYVSQNFTYAGGILSGISNYIKSVTSFAAYTPIVQWQSKDNKKKTIVGSYSTSLSLMLPQFQNYNGEWLWKDANSGATASEMLYIDGTTIALGHDLFQNQSFLFDNKLSLEYSIVDGLLAWDTFVSATGISVDLNPFANNSLNWYFAGGTGLKIKISGFPLGLYLVKDATFMNSDNTGFAWNKGSLFNFTKDGIFNGVKLVLSISTNLF